MKKIWSWGKTAGLAATVALACGNADDKDDAGASSGKGGNPGGKGGRAQAGQGASGQAGRGDGAAGADDATGGRGGTSGGSTASGGSSNAASGGDANAEGGTSAGDGNEDGGTGTGAEGGASATGGGGTGGAAGSGAEAGAAGEGGGASSGPQTPDQLIDAAMDAGTLTDEEALVYKVYATFRDPRLPAEYAGEPVDTLESNIMIEAAARRSTLSSETQALLAPFFQPPAFVDSWAADRLPTPALKRAGADTALAAAAPCATLFQAVISTDHTNIFYMEMPGYDNRFEKSTADFVAAHIEDIWSKQKAIFGREPPSDAGITSECNGGDGKLDIYVSPFYTWSRPGAKAVTIPYGDGCPLTPSKILIQAGLDEETTRSVLAHEFFHTLELGAYALSADCEDYRWLGEATANTMMDLCFPGDQYEHPYAAGYMQIERTVPIDQAGEGVDPIKENGYLDYIFIDYVAKEVGLNELAAIWDNAEGTDSIGALSAGLGGSVNLRTIWPNFALALWNDQVDHVHDDFGGSDELTSGLKQMFDMADAGFPHGDKSQKVELTGQPRGHIDLLNNFGRIHVVPRLSVEVDYLKFTDDKVRSVGFVNSAAFADFPDLKIQALTKINGTWTTEDWTKEPLQSFCRDKNDENIQELVLLYSNADGTRPSDDIDLYQNPRLAFSNVGCFRWEGSASVLQNDGSNTYDCRATDIAFIRSVGPSSPTVAFETESGGSVVASEVVTIGPGCQLESNATGTINAIDGGLRINLDLDLGVGAPDRLVVQGYGTTDLSGDTLFNCPPTVEPGTGQQGWHWLTMPDLTHSVSADGQSITGAGGDSQWSLHAVRE